jgi:hypothetical protein
VPPTWRRATLLKRRGKRDGLLTRWANRGTASLIVDEPRIWQVDVSVSGFDFYQSTDRARLKLVDQPCEYILAVNRKLKELDSEGIDFDLCICNAGMDPHEDCSTGGLKGITTGGLAYREAQVFSWCQRRSLPLAFVLAGGYMGSIWMRRVPWQETDVARAQSRLRSWQFGRIYIVDT